MIANKIIIIIVIIIIIINTWSTRNCILHIIPSWLTCCFSTTESTSEPAFRLPSVAWWKLYGVGRLKEGRSWDFLKKLVNNLLPWSKKRIPHNQITWFSVNYKAFSTMKKLLKKILWNFSKKKKFRAFCLKKAFTCTTCGVKLTYQDKAKAMWLLKRHASEKSHQVKAGWYLDANNNVLASKSRGKSKLLNCVTSQGGKEVNFFVMDHQLRPWFRRYNLERSSVSGCLLCKAVENMDWEVHSSKYLLFFSSSLN